MYKLKFFLIFVVKKKKFSFVKKFDRDTEKIGLQKKSSKNYTHCLSPSQF